MLLKYQHTYLSIDSFVDVEIPSFCVLTGVNGSGKTHLLEAIARGAVTISGIQTNSIVSFNFESFKLDNEKSHSAHSISESRQAVWNGFETNLQHVVRQWTVSLRDQIPYLASRAFAEGKTLWDMVKNPAFEQYKAQLTNFLQLPQYRGQPWSEAIMLYAKNIDTTLDQISKERFMAEYKPITFKDDFLPQELGRLIWFYNMKIVQNDLNQFQNEKHGYFLPVLDNEAFFKENGNKPWEVINAILQQFTNLHYFIDSPEGRPVFEDYQLKLVHRDKVDVQIEFSNLSSGERILMALVASVYRASLERNYPRLLLLDELDATLHPSMVKNLIAVLTEIFVSKGTKVILVTHSPTTVALCDEGALFVVNKMGPNRIEKASRQQALSILTEGFATLDEGILLFDQVTRESFSVISEGRNARILEMAFKLYGVDGINVISQVEAASGKDQLKTLYDFMLKVPHKSKILFVWDCDVKKLLPEGNNTFSFRLEQNPSNALATKGIENIFPESSFDGFIKTINMSNGVSKKEFDETRKADFERALIDRCQKTEFSGFKPLIDFISRLRGI